MLFLVPGLNYGIDFSGGTIIEARTQGPADLAAMRADLDSLGLGEVQLQGFGAPNEVLIRLPRQPGNDQAQEAAVAKVQAEARHQRRIPPHRGGGADGRRRADPRRRDRHDAWRWCAIAVYVWFRFEWQFGVGAMLSTLHDTITTVGLFSLLQIEFNLTTLAAILTIAGYSINDTVVIYDRVRETMRKQPHAWNSATLINKSLNETLSRTILTVSRPWRSPCCRCSSSAARCCAASASRCCGAS